MFKGNSLNSLFAGLRDNFTEITRFVFTWLSGIRGDNREINKEKKEQARCVPCDF